MFPLFLMLGSLSLLAQTLAAPTPDSISLNIGGQEVTISSNGPITVGASSAGTGPSSNSSTPTNAKAVYFMTNDKGNNSVVALNVAANGTLSFGSLTPTGGSGMTGIVGSTGAPATTDGLFSQGAVKVAGNMLVAVNPGSNTASMFTISPTDATVLTMVGQPIDTQGDFPMSVTISPKLGQACIANSGNRAGVACFSMSATKGLTPLANMNALKPFDIAQSTPPVGAPNTVSQVFFNEDQSALMTTVKGNPAVNNTGFLSIAPVSNGMVDGNQEVRTSPAGTAVLFGTANIPGNTSAVFVTDASFGSATLAISPDNQATVSAKTVIADQSATCWATISDATKSAFVTDVAVNHLVEVNYDTGALIMEYNQTNGNAGMIDLAAAGNFIYALSPGNATHVAVFDVSGGQGTAKMVQNFLVDGVGASAQGMTFA